VLVACGSHAQAPAPSPSYLDTFKSDAKAMDRVVTSPFAHRFLSQAERLPSVGPDSADENYYEADVSAPLHFVLPMNDVPGVDWHPGMRLLDFGYGSIGHLRLLSFAGVDASGIEARKELATLYAKQDDPHIHLFNGHWPGELGQAVGGGYDLIVSKNTLKKGYIHPDREAPEKQLIHLGVDDATFLAALKNALVPHGQVLIYNIFVPLRPMETFKPMSDGRSPWTKEEWTAAGFDVEAFDVSDTEKMHSILAVTAEGQPSKTIKSPPEYVSYQSLYTLVRRRD
jgi:hypothetical protein